MTQTGVIGIDCLKGANTGNEPQQIIPWNIPDDLKNFRAITAATKAIGHTTAVFMGRKTYASVVPFFPKSVFPGRVPIVLSGTTKFDPTHPEVIFVDTISPELLNQYTVVNIIGGAGLVNSSFDTFAYQDLHLTYVDHDCEMIKPELNPVRINMERLNKLLDNYTQMNDGQPNREFNGKCSLCEANITARYIHYHKK
jgi:dihydrofolate reductase